MRRDCCPCAKPDGVYGRQGFHLEPSKEYPDSPACDRVVARCPAWREAIDAYQKTQEELADVRRRLEFAEGNEREALLREEAESHDEVLGWAHRLQKELHARPEHLTPYRRELKRLVGKELAGREDDPQFAELKGLADKLTDDLRGSSR